MTNIQIRLMHITCAICGREFEARCEDLDHINCVFCGTLYQVNLTLKIERVGALYKKRAADEEKEQRAKEEPKQ